MTELVQSSAKARAAQIRTRLKRFKLVFIQCGTVFEVLRPSLLDSLGGEILDATEFAGRKSSLDLPDGPVVLDGLEAFARDGKSGSATLGQLRAKVNALRDGEAEVCLVSRAPRISFAPVPGSNLLSDASWHYLPLLEAHECLEEVRDSTGWCLPSIGLGHQTDIDRLLREALDELGVNALTALDFTIFEANHDASFAGELEPGVAEAMRGAGLAYVIDDALRFISPCPFWKFKNAVADVIATVVGPQADLPDVAQGLWQIERTIRKALRDAAIESSGAKWRKNLFNEAITQNVLERARNDVNVTAMNISDLRDPIEWLTLSELLDVAKSPRFGGLNWDAIAWRRFSNDIMPIRNRLSHMRLLKQGDKATVHMWRNRVMNAFS